MHVCAYLNLTESVLLIVYAQNVSVIHTENIPKTNHCMAGTSGIKYTMHTGMCNCKDLPHHDYQYV